MRGSAVLTFGLYLGFLALAAGLAAVLGGSTFGRPRAIIAVALPILEREKDLALGLGWSVRTWWAVRLLAVLAAVAAAVPTGIPLVILASPVAAVLAVPYILSGRASARRMQRERTLVDWVRTAVSRMRRNQGIDVILRDGGVHPPYGLEWTLAPLADSDLLIDEALVQVTERARLPEAEMLALALLASRPACQEDLVLLLESVVLPVMEARLAEQVDALEATTQKRSQAVAMSLIMISMFMALIRVEVIRRGFMTLPGQAVLAVTGVTFALVLFLVSRLYRIRTFTRWDLEAYRVALRAAGNV